MKIKKYVANDMKEAIELIRKDLGNQAIIVSQQVVSPPGIFGFLKKKQIEVTAAVEEHQIKEKEKPKFKPRTHQRYEEQLNYKKADDEGSEISPVKIEELNKEEKSSEFKPGLLIKSEQELKPDIRIESKEIPSNQNKLEQPMEAEIKEIKNLVEKMSTQSNVVIDVNQQLSQSISNQLREFDFSDEFKEAWQQYLINQKSENREVSQESLYGFVKQEVKRLISIGNQSTPKIQIFVGPPGVGKTTTIAKIASNELIYHQRKVGLITVDTYRIGAVEQLKTYANILNIPIKVVYNKDEMEHAIEELQSCDRIIIDSVGRTHRDQENLVELKTLFESITHYNCYLVLSMSMKYRQLARIMENYQSLNYNHLVLTKLDECERNEIILNICYNQSYPIAYLCTGQEVPADIEVPSMNRILNLIWGGDSHA